MEESKPDTWLVATKGGVNVVVPATLHDLAAYVLLEQENWFEDEINFISHIVARGGVGVSIDIGANYGVYALLIAKLVGNRGTVWAFEPSTTTADCLQAGIQANQLSNIFLRREGVSDRVGEANLVLHPNHAELNYIDDSASESVNHETVKTRTLDDCLKCFGWKDISFIKIDAEGHELKILQGSRCVLTTFSPLIMFELMHQQNVNLSLLSAFREFQYQAYRYVPAIGALVPFDPNAPFDPYLINLFCCKREKAAQLEGDGLLVMDVSDLRNYPGDRIEWKHFLARKAYAKALLPKWEKHVTKRPLAGWSEYKHALDYFANAQRHDFPVSLRLASLKRASVIMQSLVQQHTTIPRIMTLARIWHEIGERAKHLECLKLLITHLGFKNNEITAEEPFLPVSARYDDIYPGNKLKEWCLSSLYEQYERRAAQSSYFTGTDALDFLRKVRSLGFQSAEVERRWRLIHLRHGLRDTVQMDNVMSRLSDENLNREWWANHPVTGG